MCVVCVSLVKMCNNSVVRNVYEADTIMRGPRSAEDPALVVEGLYIGSAASAGNGHHLWVKGVRAVVNCAEEVPNFAEDKFEYLRLGWREVEGELICDVENDVVAFIDRHRKLGHGVLVHCLAGVSRSASICIMYLVRRHGMGLKAAFSTVFARRPVIHPNGSLWKQLCAMTSTHISIDECKSQATFDIRDQDHGVIRNLEQLLQAYKRAESMSTGSLHLNCNYLNFETEPLLTEQLLKPPRRVTLISLGKDCVISEQAKTQMKSKLHIVFVA